MLWLLQTNDAVETIEDHGKSDSSTQQTDSMVDEAAGQTEPTDSNDDHGVGKSQAPESEGHSGESIQITASPAVESGKVWNLLTLGVNLTFQDC